MPVRVFAEVHPRNVGEILDDGWRLYLADGPLLLALSGVFLIPAAAAILALLTQNPSTGTGWGWPALCALLLPLTGLGAGACQETFHLWAENSPATIRECLKAACRRGLNHALVQLLALLLPTAALAWLLLPNLPLWARWLGALVLLLLAAPVCLVGIARHAVLAAGQKNPWKAWRRSSRASGRHPVKAMIVLATRAVLVVFAVLNLHVLGQLALWAAESLGGFDVALAGLLCSLGNPPYLFSLLALAWWLLTPYFEAVNYLFFVDDRTRYEGLDLWYRVEELFPRLPSSRAGVALLALTTLLFGAPAARAEDRLTDVRAARQDIGRIAREVKQLEPYPGSPRWKEPLRAVGRRLDPKGSPQQGRFRWYFQSIDGFENRDRAGALHALDGIANRLAVIESNLERSARAGAARSKEQIKELVPREGEAPKNADKEKPPPHEEKEKAVEKDAIVEAGPADRGGVAMLGPVELGGLAYLLLIFLLGLIAAVVVVAAVLAVGHWLQNRPPATARREGSVEPAGEELLEGLDRQDVSRLWRQSDDLARAGRFLEAVRTLYLAVLALLHQAALIRFERTRTNGEYADQLRPLSNLHTPFVRLTDLFEIKWYGQRACREGDYTACRGYAEDIQLESRAPRTAG